MILISFQLLLGFWAILKILLGPFLSWPSSKGGTLDIKMGISLGFEKEKCFIQLYFLVIGLVLQIGSIRGTYLLCLSKIILDFSPFLVGILTPLCPFTKPHHIYLHNSAGSLERRLPHCAPLFTESYYICTHILKVIAQKSWDVALQMCRQ